MNNDDDYVFWVHTSGVGTLINRYGLEKVLKCASIYVTNPEEEYKIQKCLEAVDKSVHNSVDNLKEGL
jgi:hypothetical protein